MATEIKVPDLGDFKDVEVIDVLVKAGDKIEIDTPLLTLETEKATMDVPATEAGVVKSVAVKKGDRVSQGSLILILEAAGAQNAAAAEKKADAPAKQPAAATSQTTPAASPQAAAATAGASSTETITVPDIGDFKDVEVIEVLVKPGDQIEVD